MSIPADIRAKAEAVVIENFFEPHLIDAIAEALLAEREAATKAENERWKDSDEAARESGLMLDPFDLAEAIMNERERCAKIAKSHWNRGGPSHKLADAIAIAIRTPGNPATQAGDKP